jgi:nucleotide-binding universal stress UspA family protein
MSTATLPIIVGIDGRPAALRAVAWAAHEADRRGLPLRLVAVVPDEAPDPRAMARRAHGDLADARRAALASAAVVTATEVASGSPAEVLALRSAFATLVVLGDERTPEASTVGPVSAALAAAAACPVVVVPARWSVARHAGEVVAAVDPEEPDGLRDAVVWVAADVARRWCRPLLIAVVLPGARAPDVRAARRTFDACPDDLGPDVTVHQVLGHGDPVEELLGLTCPGTGLLVLGASDPDRPAADAVGRAVRARASCPVVVVPSVRSRSTDTACTVAAVGQPA